MGGPSPAPPWSAGALALLLLTTSPHVRAAERPSPSDQVMHRQWTGQWLACPEAPVRDPGVFRFRKVLDLPEKPGRYVVHVSADNRFVLSVNGRRIGIGPARGDLYFWRFETFDLAPFLVPGRNLLTALVWNFGMEAPVAQVNLRTGFVMQGDEPDERAADTDASWECAAEPGHAPWPEGARAVREEAHQYFVVGPGERLDAAAYDWDWAKLPPPGGAEAARSRWSPAVPYGAPSPRSIREGPGSALSPEGRLLVPDELPPQEYRPVPAGEVVRASGARMAEGFPTSGTATIGPHATATILLDRQTLVAAYPEVAFSGGRGARLRLTYQEALVDEDFEKRNRNEIEGKRMVGLSDEVLPDGGRGRTFHPLWWRTWRYLQLDVVTAEEPLTIDGVRAFATGYPFEAVARVDTDDDTLGRIWDVGWRTARLCAHETYVDCPYYEQLQYVGDTRIQALLSYVVSGDDRLARQAIRAFDHSRRSDGITSSRYPAREPQYIPPFSLLWVGMVHDFWLYRDDPAFVREQLPGTRTVLEWFLDRTSPSGLLGRLPWWSFVDWADPDFADGVPPQERDGQSAPITLQMVNALREAADLEEALGDAERAALYRRRARGEAEAVGRLCWDEGRGLVADRPSKDRFSQQTNILAVLADALPEGRLDPVLDKVLAAGLRPPEEGGAAAGPAAPNRMTPASYYFRFYLARALEKAGRGNAYLLQLEPWREMLDLGLSTWAEQPGRTRSDCHAWSAHPNYDLLTIVAGIRPAAPGFRSVRIEPHLGTLDRLEVRMPHPRGVITVSYRRDGRALAARIHLPAGLGGEFAWGDLTRTLREGDQSFRME